MGLRCPFEHRVSGQSGRWRLDLCVELPARICAAVLLVLSERVRIQRQCGTGLRGNQGYPLGAELRPEPASLHTRHEHRLGRLLRLTVRLQSSCVWKRLLRQLKRRGTPSLCGDGPGNRQYRGAPRLFATTASRPPIVIAWWRAEHKLELHLVKMHRQWLQSGGANTGFIGMDAYDPGFTNGLCDFDQPLGWRNTIVWSTPSLASHDVLTRTALASWTLSGNVTLDSGQPYSVLTGNVDNSYTGEQSTAPTIFPGRRCTRAAG